MNRVAKFITALQALLIAPLGAAGAGDAPTPSELSEAAAWQAALSSGTPEALQRFISRFPQGDHLNDAFGLIVESEVQAANSDAASRATAVQLSEAGLEVLERDFDLGVGRTLENQNEDNRGLTPY